MKFVDFFENFSIFWRNQTRIEIFLFFFKNSNFPFLIFFKIPFEFNFFDHSINNIISMTKLYLRWNRQIFNKKIPQKIIISIIIWFYLLKNAHRNEIFFRKIWMKSRPTNREILSITPVNFCPLFWMFIVHKKVLLPPRDSILIMSAS